MSKKAQFLLINLAFLGVLIGVVIVITRAYISQEHYFYYWDYAMYQQITNDQVYVAKASPIGALRLAYSSLGDDYNKLYTLPLIPVLIWLGHASSRISYIQSLSIVYLLPNFLILGFIARKVFPSRSSSIFWIAILIALLTPATWLPTLRGYPDTGGAFLMFLATWIYLYDPKLRMWWQIPLLGISCACAILFRRHFVYAASALILGILIVNLIRFLNGLRSYRKESIHNFIVENFRLILVVFVILGVLLSIGRSFIDTVLQRNTHLFYTSWQMSPLQVLYNFQDYYGWAGIIFASIGVISGLIHLTKDRKGVALATLLSCVSAVQWTIWVRQFNPQYTLYFTPYILLGLITLTVIILKLPKRAFRWAGIFSITIYLIVNAIFGVFRDSLDNTKIIQEVFASQTAPLRLESYDEIVKLVHKLHQIVAKKDTVAVVASSGIINNDLIKAADRQIYPSLPIKFIFTPEIDTRDTYPIELLLQAKYVLVATPFQSHLAASEHEVLKAVYQIFNNSWEIRNKFKLLPESVPLTENVQIDIYQRADEIEPGLAIRTLSQIQDFVGENLPNQPDWIRLDNFSSSTTNNRPEGYKIQANLVQSTSYLYLGNIPMSGELSGNMSVRDEPCGRVSVHIASSAVNGELTPLDEFQFLPSSEQPLSFKFQNLNSKYIVMTLTRENYELGICQIVLKQLHIVSSTP